jgi:hypothetical protein
VHAPPPYRSESDDPEFPEEFLAENNLVLQLAGEGVMSGIPRIPDPSLAHEAEPRAVNDCGAFALRISAEEDRRPDDPLESAHEPPILRSALLHPEGVQHLRRAPKADDATALLNRQGREEDRHQAVLAPRQSVGRVPGYLKQKLAVPAFMQELPGRRSLNRQPTENKWSGGEAEVLAGFLPLQTNAGNGFGAAKPLLRDEQFRVSLTKNGPGRSEAGA